MKDVLDEILFVMEQLIKFVPDAEKQWVQSRLDIAIRKLEETK